MLALDYFEDRLGLDDHLVLIEEVEALDEQLVAAALDVEHAQRGARFLVAGSRRSSARASRRRCDLVLRRVVQRLRELLFLRADHVADVRRRAISWYFSPRQGIVCSSPRSVSGSWLVTMTSVSVFFPR
jgi:hypothetical protein